MGQLGLIKKTWQKVVIAGWMNRPRVDCVGDRMAASCDGIWESNLKINVWELCTNCPCPMENVWQILKRNLCQKGCVHLELHTQSKVKSSDKHKTGVKRACSCKGGCWLCVVCVCVCSKKDTTCTNSGLPLWTGSKDSSWDSTSFYWIERAIHTGMTLVCTVSMVYTTWCSTPFRWNRLGPGVKPGSLPHQITAEQKHCSL